ncbi:C_GCAxxG_C_C family protein [Desulfobulbus rhabdoformis]|uniref:C-GCAxxG-C-C family protein n=1 Tax=Desulfobulbus rhabdoformis TaxID=34032 RepID=UPI001963E864|nr:C-GCAxxG-C-C family protein [Desulfobulbus rhabdoformis]MBM9614015.1 C_GCAxxG_C_C family protein [Desulfobulbus rhabdoformis]
MRPDEMQEKAQDLFLKRLHCSQVLAMIGQEKLGVQDPSVIKALGSFGGGIGGTGHVCGALVGAASVIGTLYSRSSLEEKENPRMWAATKKVMKSFKDLTDEYGGINCGEIARVDWMNRDEVKNFYGNAESRRQHCLKVVGETARLLGEVLENEAEVMAAKEAEKKAQ